MGGIEAGLKAKLVQFRRKLAERRKVQRMIVFGSRAVGGAGRDSDVDVILVSPDFSGMPFTRRSVGLLRLWEASVPMDLICLTPDEFEERARRITIVREAVRQGVEIA